MAAAVLIAAAVRDVCHLDLSISGAAAMEAVNRLKRAGYRIVRPHDWHAEERWVGDPMARMVCWRCGVKDGEVPLSADCEG